MKNTVGVISLCFILAGPTLAAANIPIQNSDAEILGTLSVIDQNEIQAAQLAEQKTINHKIINYARMADTDYNEHLDRTRELSQKLGMVIEDNAFLDQFRSQNDQDMAVLTALDAKDFSQLYIEDMIKGYAEALQWIGMQDTRNQQLKNFLQETREYIARHLQKAQMIREYQQDSEDD